ncbi:DedA family protein [Priestia koreensis]|uniref:VTT domain-containing protein n=1 Tax=Priestia koreensis TaxID=284581 RepID=A0A0M0L4W8_9BACI|nr:DedA family protein [Priestia koreensis]KOO46115.1 hypothetical protein AMD01_09595 [Priestia koreensis]
MNEIVHLLNQYGYIVLFISLMLELIIVPIPNEALMSYVGVLCYQGDMNIYLSILSAGLGGVAGVSVSYWIGYKLGAPFFRKYGHYVHMGPDKLEKMEKWYEKYGRVLVMFSYFIPGVRHVASIFSGVIHLPFRIFSIFAYIGVFIWVSTFMVLGNILGPKWHEYEGEIKKWLVVASIIVAIVGILYFVIKTNLSFIKESAVLLFEYIFQRYHSLLKIKFIVLSFLLLFIAFITLMVIALENLISNEFGNFDAIIGAIILSVFGGKYVTLMQVMSNLSSWWVLGIASFITLVLIFFNRKHRWMEMIFFAATVLLTFLSSTGIHWLLHYFIDGSMISPTVPDVRTMLFLSVFSFFFLMVARHHGNVALGVTSFVLYIVVLGLYAISGIYLFRFLPSDIAISYLFSAVLVSGGLLALETFRFLALIKEHMYKEKQRA